MNNIITKDLFEYSLELCKKFSNIPIKIEIYDIANHYTFYICEKTNIISINQSKGGRLNAYNCDLERVTYNSPESLDLFNSINNSLCFSYNYRELYCPSNLIQVLFMDICINDSSIFVDEIKLDDKYKLKFKSQRLSETNMPILKGCKEDFEKLESDIKTFIFNELIGV